MRDKTRDYASLSLSYFVPYYFYNTVLPYSTLILPGSHRDTAMRFYYGPSPLVIVS